MTTSRLAVSAAILLSLGAALAGCGRDKKDSARPADSGFDGPPVVPAERLSRFLPMTVANCTIDPTASRDLNQGKASSVTRCYRGDDPAWMFAITIRYDETDPRSAKDRREAMLGDKAIEAFVGDYPAVQVDVNLQRQFIVFAGRCIVTLTAGMNDTQLLRNTAAAFDLAALARLPE
ncbi:MAG: hypothetical protein BIFFINMI_01095 [Phycisphaerae bacterium]|nr:hypothetical protein [Phycisphaerae bacterium]